MAFVLLRIASGLTPGLGPRAWFCCAWHSALSPFAHGLWPYPGPRAWRGAVAFKSFAHGLWPYPRPLAWQGALRCAGLARMGFRCRRWREKKLAAGRKSDAHTPPLSTARLFLKLLYTAKHILVLLRNGCLCEKNYFIICFICENNFKTIFRKLFETIL